MDEKQIAETIAAVRADLPICCVCGKPIEEHPDLIKDIGGKPAHPDCFKDPEGMEEVLDQGLSTPGFPRSAS